MTAGSVVLAVEADQVRTHPAVLDLAALGRELSREGTVEVCWLVVGSQAGEAGARIAEDSGCPVMAVETPQAISTGEGLCRELLPLLEELRPEIVALLHTCRSQDCAAALALGLDAACITGVQGIARRGPELVFQRSVYGGKWLTEIAAEGRPAVLTVLPGFFRFETAQGRRGSLETRPSSAAGRDGIRLIEIRESAGEAALRQAENVVAAGHGIGSRENMVLVERLAALFPKSAVAGSRIVCDAGWLPYARQVGVTGATVAPALYLACGISGAFQHVAGMSGARFVAAINRDPQAAIFNAADIGVVADLNTFLPLLIEALEKNEEEDSPRFTMKREIPP